MCCQFKKNIKIILVRSLVKKEYIHILQKCQKTIYARKIKLIDSNILLDPFIQERNDSNPRSSNGC